MSKVFYNNTFTTVLHQLKQIVLCTSLIKPILEYVCMAWAPHTNKDISFIESVQRCAARFFLTTTLQVHFAETLQRLNWKPLVHCRNQLKAITVFKIIHNLINIPANTHGSNTTFMWLQLTPVATKEVQIWNSLSNDIISSTTLNQFKQKLAGLDLSLSINYLIVP